MPDKTPCILLVEDNPDDVELTKRALAKNNIANDMAVVDDGQKALDYLFRRGEYASRSPEDQPCLVLLDIQLPKINGLQVLEEIRANPETQMIPVVMLTSSNEERDLIQSYGTGANSYIRKPVDFEQFVSAVSQLGVYWLVLNEPPPAK